MKILKVKTFTTIFLMLSLFLFSIIVVTNYQTYKREKDNIKRNITRINNLSFNANKKPFKPNLPVDLNNHIIMDYEVYTVILNNNSVIDIISHSEKTTLENIEEIAKKIISKNNESTIKINNLYFSSYSYNYQKNNYITIINNQNIKERLHLNLITSFIALIIFECFIFYFSKLITKWITKPAVDSFNKQKDFIADASHELKTPLSVIMACADSLDNDPNEKKWLSNIKNETEKMNNLITNLLNLSKLENGINKENYSNHNLSKIVEKTALTFESLAYDNKLEIETSIKKNINFICSEVEITELLSILIDNAIKHGQKNTSIKITLSTEREEIVIKVINQGEEIPKEECEKIFERFYRLDKSRNRTSGRYGLGLAITKNIVINHNGKITASSKDGYTTFKITFKYKEH